MSTKADWKCDECEARNELSLAEVDHPEYFKSCGSCETLHLLEVKDSRVKVLTQMSRG